MLPARLPRACRFFTTNKIPGLPENIDENFPQSWDSLRKLQEYLHLTLELEKPHVDINKILEEYPISLNAPRNSIYEPVPTNIPLFEKLFALRFKRAFATKNMINQRFINLTPDYFPNEFLQGAIHVPGILLQLLSNWNGDAQDKNGQKLREICKPRLFSAFQKAHSAFSNTSSESIPAFTFYDVKDQIIKDSWFCFGANPDSCLPSGQVLQKLDPTSVIKKNNKGVVVRKLNFSYLVSKKDYNERRDEIHTNLLSQAMKSGCMIGVDVHFDFNFGMEVGDLSVKRTEMMLRFETPVLPNPHKDGAEWFVSDVDNYFTSLIRKEEE